MTQWLHIPDAVSINTAALRVIIIERGSIPIGHAESGQDGLI